MALKRLISLSVSISIFFSCIQCTIQSKSEKENARNNSELIVLGIAQDAGYPQIDCEKECCQAYWEGKREKERVTCLGLIDRIDKKAFLVEASPDIYSQWQSLKEECPECDIEGIVITHAHIGHYTGLMQLGREAMGAKNVKVFVLPRLANFLRENGPWSQLVTLGNIEIIELTKGTSYSLSRSLKVTPYLVPHRDEFSETAGFVFNGQEKRALFIPDIDKWDKWDKNIIDEIKNVDYAFIDGTFFNEDELPGRNMSEIPHPFIAESIDAFNSLDRIEKEKIWFTHFNHTNAVLDIKDENRIFAQNLGFNFAIDGGKLSL